MAHKVIKEQILCFIFLICLSSTVFSVSYADSNYNLKFTDTENGNDKNFSYQIKDDEVIINGYTGADKESVCIPCEINGKPVTEIAANAFYNNTNINIIIIPDTVCRIGSNAFWSSGIRKLVFLGETVEIDSSAFYNYVTVNCIKENMSSKLKKVVLKGDVYLTPSVLVQDGDIIYEVFSDHANACKYLGTDGIMKIKESISGIPVTQIANWYTLYDDGLFWDYYSGAMDSEEYKVTELYIPSSIQNIDIMEWRGETKPVFNESNGLKKLVIEDGAAINIETILEQPYHRDTNLLAEKVWSGLETINVGGSVKNLSPYLFYGLNLREIIVSKTNTNYTAQNNILFDKKMETLIVSATKNPITEYTVPDSVKKIEVGFNYCSALEKLTIGANVNSIGKNAINTQSEKLVVYVWNGTCAHDFVKNCSLDYVSYVVVDGEEKSDTVDEQNQITDKDKTDEQSQNLSGNSDEQEQPVQEGIGEEETQVVDTTEQLPSSVLPPPKNSSTIKKDIIEDDDDEDDEVDDENSDKESTVVKVGKVKSVKTKNQKKGKIKITWKKVSSVKGYQIQYAKNKTFTKGKKIKKTKKTKITIKNLKKKKTYYFRVRAYVINSGGEKVYGKWCYYPFSMTQ